MNTVPEGLLLYYHRFSFYSQKVVMTLYEKNLTFDSRIVNLFQFEQFSPWFIALNNRCEIPVLKDTGKIIPDSSRIIDYLEDNFSNGNTPRLIPMNLGADVRQKVNNYRRLFESIPANVVTLGAIIHKQHSKRFKVPFIGRIKNIFANNEKKFVKKLLESAETHQDMNEIFLRRAREKEEIFNVMMVETNYLALLKKIDIILQQVEDELNTHIDEKKDWWLCCQQFTIADIELAVLLERLNQLGLEEYFWMDNKPNIILYYERVKERDSFKKTIPNTMYFIRSLIGPQIPFIATLMTTVALIIGGIIVAKKYSSYYN